MPHETHVVGGFSAQHIGRPTWAFDLAGGSFQRKLLIPVNQSEEEADHSKHKCCRARCCSLARELISIPQASHNFLLRTSLITIVICLHCSTVKPWLRRRQPPVAITATPPREDIASPRNETTTSERLKPGLQPNFHNAHRLGLVRTVMRFQPQNLKHPQPFAPSSALCPLFGSRCQPLCKQVL